jgi:hyperosmotically inducible protein
MRIALFTHAAHVTLATCAVFAAACAGNDNRPAQDPSSAASSTTLTNGAANTNANANATTASSPEPVGDPLAAPMASDTTDTASAPALGPQTPAIAPAIAPVAPADPQSETKITAAIRKGLMSDTSLSFKARNVKIVTVGTKVTLRGAVSSEREKAAIESRATETPGVTDVDDKIEVKK